MRSLRVTAWLAVFLLAASCTTRESRDAQRRSGAEQDSTPLAAGVVAAAPAQDTTMPFQATTATVERKRLGRPAMLRGVRAAQGAEARASYDRVVFEFGNDSVAGYHVAYADRPARRCGSGEPVSVQGNAQLVVRFEPAQAHDASGTPAPAARELTPNLPAVKEMKLICDFEGQVEWVLGLSGREGYRVSELAGPPRVVVDVAHPR